MLIENPAQAHTEQLATPADPREWFAVTDRLFKKSWLQCIQRRIHVLQGGLFAASTAPRFRITSAAEQDSIELQLQPVAGGRRHLGQKGHRDASLCRMARMYASDISLVGSLQASRSLLAGRPMIGGTDRERKRGAVSCVPISYEDSNFCFSLARLPVLPRMKYSCARRT